MLQFEELAQTRFVQNFNTDGIQILKYDDDSYYDLDDKINNNLFYFPIDVSDGKYLFKCILFKYRIEINFFCFNK